MEPLEADKNLTYLCLLIECNSPALGVSRPQGWHDVRQASKPSALLNFCPANSEKILWVVIETPKIGLCDSVPCEVLTHVITLLPAPAAKKAHLQQQEPRIADVPPPSHRYALYKPPAILVRTQGRFNISNFNQ